MSELDLTEGDSLNGETILHSEEENTPKLFSDENPTNENDIPFSEPEQKLFTQENNREEDFEIPAFLRRQKF